MEIQLQWNQFFMIKFQKVFGDTIQVLKTMVINVSMIYQQNTIYQYHNSGI